MLLLQFKKKKKKKPRKFIHYTFNTVYTVWCEKWLGMKIQTNYNIDAKRPVIAKPCLHVKHIWSEKQLQTAASLVLTDKSLSIETPTLSLFLMENKQWPNGGFFEMWRDV